MSNVRTAPLERPELDALEARSETLRTGLADTVGELRNRLSPETIKADVKEQVAKTGQDFLAKLERSARDNPLQTAAIGAGLAYPLIGLLRSIPAPILLMGAGVALSGRNNVFSGVLGNEKVSTAVNVGTEKAADLAAVAADRASSSAASVSSAYQSATDQVTDATAAVAAKVSDTVAGLTQSAADTAGSAAHSARRGYHDGLHAVGDTADRAVALGRQSGERLVDTVQRNPLLVGALTALAGAALAALIPASRTENRLFGETSTRLKEQAKASASEGMHAAMDAGQRVVGTTLHAASDEGLDAETGREAIRDVADRTGAVVDAAVRAVVPTEEPAPAAAARQNAAPDFPNRTPDI